MMANDEDEDNLYEVDCMIDIFDRIGINYTFATLQNIIELFKPYKTENWDSNNRTSLTSKTVVFKSLQNINSSVSQSDIVTLRINEGKVDVNKNVLALHSEYFNTMFSSNFNEKYQNKTEFNIADISFENLKTIVKYFNGLEFTITEHNVQDLLIVSTIFMIQDVQEACVDYFKTVIDSENCIVIKTFADALDLKDLYELCLNFIVNNFRFIANNPEFINLSFEEVLFIVRNNDLHAEEIQVYEAVMNWIRYKPISRVKCTVELLWYVRFPLILHINNESSAYYDLTSHRMNIGELFRTQYRNPQRKGILLLSFKPLCFNWYDATIDQWHPYYATTRCACTTLLNIFRPRETSSYLMLDSGNMFCVGGKVTNQSSYIFNPEKMAWVHLRVTNYQHIKPYVVQVGFKIFVISDGNIRNRMVNLMEFFNIKEQDWVSVPFSITEFHMDFTYVAHARGLVYIISSNKAVFYDPEDKVFQDISNLPRRIRGAAVCTLNNNIYIIGGKCNGHYLNSVYAYCTETKVWVSVADMNCSRSHSGVAVMNGSIYVFGGRNGTNSCSNTFEVYESQKDKWVTSTATMNSACYNIDAFVLKKDDTLYKSTFNDSNIRF